jgi:hypothetical protein
MANVLAISDLRIQTESVRADGMRSSGTWKNAESASRSISSDLARVQFLYRTRFRAAHGRGSPTVLFIGTSRDRDSDEAFCACRKGTRGDESEIRTCRLVFLKKARPESRRYREQEPGTRNMERR